VCVQKSEIYYYIILLFYIIRNVTLILRFFTFYALSLSALPEFYESTFYVFFFSQKVQIVFIFIPQHRS
jgi:hypothetical protein